MNAIVRSMAPETVAFFFQIGLALQPSFPSGYGLWFAQYLYYCLNMPLPGKPLRK